VARSMWRIISDVLVDLGIKIGILAVFLLTALAWALTN